MKTHNCNECAEPMGGVHSIWCDLILEETGMRIKDNPDVINGITTNHPMLSLRKTLVQEGKWR